MTCLIARDNYIAISKGLCINFHDYTNLVALNIPEVASKELDTDEISDIASSSDSKYLAVITSTSKRLMVYSIPLLEHINTFTLPRSASKIRFTNDNLQVLVADKSGDVLSFDLQKDGSGTKLLGHLSLIIDVLHTHDGKYIISSDRDEKIKVSCYPNTYNIQTYCLGHREFVNHLEILPHNDKYLTSTSGDGTIKIWDFTKGHLCYTLDTYADIIDVDLKESFVKLMDTDGVEVNTLPIVHYGTARVSEKSSLLAVAVYSYNILLVYCLHTVNNQFSHTLEAKLNLKQFPSAINLNESNLFIYYKEDGIVNIFNVLSNNGKITLESSKEIKMLNNIETNAESKDNFFETIKVLYKRKFDNVQEYQERKKQRLEKFGQ